MSEREFRFKRFKLLHGGDSIPIGTDAVILGAYAGKSFLPEHILDIGTGSGIIALMLAQRFENALIDAVEINPEASLQAEQNFLRSPFANRLTIFNSGISIFQPSLKYDLIVSNPPYFSDSIKSPNQTRTRSRHDEIDILSAIFSFASQYLKAKGLLQIIYPFDSISKAMHKAKQHHLNLISQLNILPSPGKEAVRVILSFSLISTSKVEQNTLCIENNARHDYHQDYIRLCKDFYLKFPD